MEYWAQIRSKFLGLPYGDQGFLIHRDLLDTIEEFPKIPIMEDIALADRLKSKIKPLDILAHTSAEKYHKNGWLRQSMINFFILIQYFWVKIPINYLNFIIRINLKKFTTFKFNAPVHFFCQILIVCCYQGCHPGNLYK